jgi:hypothetical protein
MGRVYPDMKEKPRDTQLRWEFMADQQDMRTDRCAAFHDDLKKTFGAPH